MTVNNQANTVAYTGNSITTVFPYTFRIPDDDMGHVGILDIATSILTNLSPGDYVISGIGSDFGGTVTYNPLGVPLPNTKRIVIYRELDLVQELDLTNQTPYFAETLEETLDRIVMMMQQVSEAVDRAVKVTLGTETSPDDFIIALQAAANAATAAAAEATAQAGIATDQAELATAEKVLAAASALAAAASAANALASENNVAVMGVPIGMIAPFPVNAAPTGWLIANGATFSAATYPSLATYLGSTTLPDLRGEFIRGLDNGRGVDTGRVNMSGQLDALQNITGTLPTVVGGPTGTGTGALLTGAAAAANLAQTGSSFSSGPVSFDASRVVRTSTETRPRNVAMVLCIKAFGAVVNQGALDAAAVAADQLNFIRFNAAQTLTQTQKGQAHANIGSSWEQIGATITLASAQATIDWTGLSAYRHLRLTFSAAPVTSTEGIAARVGIGGVYDAGANYNIQGTQDQGASVTSSLTGATVSMQLCGSGVGNSLASRGAHGQLLVHDLNQAYPTTLESRHSYRTGAGTLINASLTADHFVAAAQDSFRLVTNSATGFLAGSTFTLEGMRG